MGTFLYCAFMVFLMIAIIVAAVYAINFISRLGNHGPSAAEEQELIKHEYSRLLIVNTAASLGQSDMLHTRVPTADTTRCVLQNGRTSNCP